MQSVIGCRHRTIMLATCVALTLLCTTMAASAQHRHEYWQGPLGITFAVVRSPGNAPDEFDNHLHRWGAVDYNYSISACEITNTQYAAFLNSVSAEGDPYGLWHAADGQRWYDEILQFQNGRGGYYYKVVAGKENNPVVRVTHRNIFRMMNWLHNGMKPDITTTDDGAYDTSQWGFSKNGRYTDSMKHDPRARFWLASEDEWYKAAYFDPNRYGPGQPGYWTYPTGHEDEPDVWDHQGADPMNSAIYFSAFSQPVATVPRTTSPWGVFDMAGNAREILASWFLDDGIPYGDAYVTRGAEWTIDGGSDRKGHRGIAFAYNGRQGGDWDVLSFRIVTYRLGMPFKSAYEH